MKITASLLRVHTTCGQCDEVERLWPNGDDPTVENLAIAAAHGLDWLWLANLLPEHIRQAFALWCTDNPDADAQMGCLSDLLLDHNP